MPARTAKTLRDHLSRRLIEDVRLDEKSSELTMATEPLHVEVEWSEITGLHDEQWDETSVSICAPQSVEQSRSAKTHRQLIFSSHNANLAVNRDAELVVCCDSRGVARHEMNA